MKEKRITIIFEDKTYSIDSKVYEFSEEENDKALVDKDVRAIQWYPQKNKGEIEFEDDTLKKNEFVEKFSDLSKYIDLGVIEEETKRQDKEQEEILEAVRIRKEQYDYKRKIEYPAVGEQLDSIIKSLDKIKESGINIGEDGDKLIDDINNIKEKYPKS